MIRVVVADVRVGIAAMIDSAPDLEVVAVAADGIELLAAVDAQQPDIAVVDVRMPVLDGIAATRSILERHPETRVLILTTFDLDDYVFEALRAGASGFLLKDVPHTRLIEGVRAVADGSMLLGPNVTRRMVGEFAGRRVQAGVVPGIADLTAREREVVLAVADGLSNAEVAARLFITEPTVKSHLSEALRKTGRRDRVQLVIAAYEAGLVG
jgi:DNA-binding NarL/FixJ family response regulator